MPVGVWADPNTLSASSVMVVRQYLPLTLVNGLSISRHSSKLPNQATLAFKRPAGSLNPASITKLPVITQNAFYKLIILTSQSPYIIISGIKQVTQKQF